MTLLEAIFMGIIQGITEFLPVSSSGHLAIFKAIFGVQTPGILFDVLLHIGTLVAVFLCYHKDIIQMLAEFFMMVGDAFCNLLTWVKNLKKENDEKEEYRKLVSNSYRKFDLLVIVASIPTAIIGVVDSDLVEMAGEILLVPGICLIITGFILLYADHVKEGSRTPKTTSYSNAFLIGIAQGIATLPGISRSGATIAACLGSDFQKSYAVKFSFIMSMPAILGSLLFELNDIDLAAITSVDVLYYLIGTVVAGFVGYICIKTMLLVVRKKKFVGFSIYCFVVGVLTIGAYFFFG